MKRRDLIAINKIWELDWPQSNWNQWMKNYRHIWVREIIIQQTRQAQLHECITTLFIYDFNKLNKQ